MHCHASRNKSCQAAMLSAESCFRVKASEPEPKFGISNVFAKAVRAHKQRVFWSFQYTADAASNVYDRACTVTLLSVSASQNNP